VNRGTVPPRGKYGDTNIVDGGARLLLARRRKNGTIENIFSGIDRLSIPG
jgi:hypothetical protein